MLLTKKRPKSATDTNKYLTRCAKCFGFYKKYNLARHYQKCTMTKTLKEDNKKRVHAVARGSILLAPEDCVLSNEIKHILGNMRNDKISLVVRNDDLIKKFDGSYAKDSEVKNILKLTYRYPKR